LSSSGRWELWVEAISLIKDNWVLGVGAMHYGYWSQYGFGHPHNFPLQIAVEYGIPLFLIVAYVLARFTVKLLRMHRNRLLNDFEIGCLWAYIAIGGVSLFSGVWVAPLTQLLTVIIVAPLLSAVLKDSSYVADNSVTLNKSLITNRARVGLITIGALVLGMSMVLLVWSDVESRLANTRVDLNKVEKPLYAPRFWQEDYYPNR
jgi:O-antigen ligase